MVWWFAQNQTLFCLFLSWVIRSGQGSIQLGEQGCEVTTQVLFLLFPPFVGCLHCILFIGACFFLNIFFTCSVPEYIYLLKVLGGLGLLRDCVTSGFICLMVSVSSETHRLLFLPICQLLLICLMVKFSSETHWVLFLLDGQGRQAPGASPPGLSWHRRGLM